MTASGGCGRGIRCSGRAARSRSLVAGASMQRDSACRVQSWDRTRSRSTCSSRVRWSAKLRAILVVDVVESVRLMEQDEDDAIRRWCRFIGVVIGMDLPRHRGRMVKSLGDGMLLEFESAIDSVECAIFSARAGNAREHRPSAAQAHPAAHRDQRVRCGRRRIRRIRRRRQSGRHALRRWALRKRSSFRQPFATNCPIALMCRSRTWAPSS